MLGLHIPSLVPIPGFTVYLGSAFVLDMMQLGGNSLGAGEGSATIPLALPPDTAGFEFCTQAFGFDPAGVAGLFTHSNAPGIRTGR